MMRRQQKSFGIYWSRDHVFVLLFRMQWYRNFKTDVGVQRFIMFTCTDTVFSTHICFGTKGKAYRIFQAQKPLKISEELYIFFIKIMSYVGVEILTFYL